MQILRKSSFKPVPWKNGGGITQEAIRVPTDGELYRWRVSVADIGASGPFSSFANYHRTMVLLAGDGVRLSFANGAEESLRETGDLLQFDGAIPTQCHLLSGPCKDLNLIVSKTLGMPAACIERLRAPWSIVSDGGRTTVLFAVRGPISISAAGSKGALETWDLIILDPGDEITLDSGTEDGQDMPLVFCATLDDNC